jgi:hypothetical protein
VRVTHAEGRRALAHRRAARSGVTPKAPRLLGAARAGVDGKVHLDCDELSDVARAAAVGGPIAISSLRMKLSGSLNTSL